MKMEPQISYDDIRTFCHVRELYVQFGSPRDGFVTVDGDGLVRSRSHSSFVPAGEMVGARTPAQVLPEASVFRLIRKDSGQIRELSRPDFAAEVDALLQRLRSKVVLA